MGVHRHNCVDLFHVHVLYTTAKDKYNYIQRQRTNTMAEDSSYYLESIALDQVCEVFLDLL